MVRDGLYKSKEDIMGLSWNRRYIENRDHLFFDCLLTKRVWNDIMGLCLVTDVPTNWDDPVSWGIRILRGRSFGASLCKLAWWASVYHLWPQKNYRIYAGEIKTGRS